MPTAPGQQHQCECHGQVGSAHSDLIGQMISTCTCSYPYLNTCPYLLYTCRHTCLYRCLYTCLVIYLHTGRSARSCETTNGEARMATPAPSHPGGPIQLIADMIYVCYCVDVVDTCHSRMIVIRKILLSQRECQRSCYSS